MRRFHPVLVLVLIALVIAVVSDRLSVPDSVYATPIPLDPSIDAIAHVDSVRALGAGRWVRCFRGPDGIVYLRNRLMTRDGGHTVEPQERIDVEPLNMHVERAMLVAGDLLYAAKGRARRVGDGSYRVATFRSTDGLTTLEADSATVLVPDGPTREPEPGEWYGLFVFGNIVVLPDGSWLMSMYGNFEQDTIVPWDRSAAAETSAMQRSFVVRSTDEGRTWNHRATIAAPRRGDPVGEGFVEPTIARLPDGRLLAVLRTGHHHPAYASWSDDDGRTWSPPVYTGLDRACDPTLLVLADGRVALAWGRRYREGWSRIGPEGDHERFEYPGEGFVNLALSEDGGLTWTTQPIARGAGSCYAYPIEVEPNVLLVQVDQWIVRVHLAPRVD